jgi:two-component system KDP operon response regulator KdpE
MSPEGGLTMGESTEDRFPALKSRRRPIDEAIDEARRVLWRAYQRGTLNEDELASTLDRLESDNGRAEPAWAPARVLLVLDQPVLVELIRLALNHGRFETHAVTTRAALESGVVEWQPHLVVLDMDLDGIQTLAFLRTRTSGSGRLPVIGLTRRGDLRNKLAAFDAGVDDILTVPFAPEEFLARVIASLRRSHSTSVRFTPVVRVGAVKIDILERTVQAGALELHLTSLEQGLLYLLAANAGRVVSREEILDTLWGVDYVADSKIVDRQVRHLRARLQDDWRQPHFIATVPGLGYRFVST